MPTPSSVVHWVHRPNPHTGQRDTVLFGQAHREPWGRADGPRPLRQSGDPFLWGEELDETVTTEMMQRSGGLQSEWQQGSAPRVPVRARGQEGGGRRSNRRQVGGRGASQGEPPSERMVHHQGNTSATLPLPGERRVQLQESVPEMGLHGEETGAGQRVSGRRPSGEAPSALPPYLTGGGSGHLPVIPLLRVVPGDHTHPPQQRSRQDGSSPRRMDQAEAPTSVPEPVARPSGPGHSAAGPSGPGHSVAGPSGPGHSVAGPSGPGHSAAGPSGPSHSAAGPSGPGHSAAGPGHSAAGPSGPGHSTAGPSGPGHSSAGPSGPGHSAAGPSGPGHSAAGPSGPGHSAAGPSGPGHSAASPSGPGHSAAGSSGPGRSIAGPSGPGLSTARPSGPDHSAAGSSGPGHSSAGPSGPGHSAAVPSDHTAAVEVIVVESSDEEVPTPHRRHRNRRRQHRRRQNTQHLTVQPPHYDVDDEVHMVRDNYSALATRISQWTHEDARRVLQATSHATPTRPRTTEEWMNATAALAPEVLYRVIIGPYVSVPAGVLSGGGSYEELIELAERLGPAGPEGILQEVIDSIPIRTYSRVPGDKPSRCVVCMNDFENEDQLRCLPCSHEFHQPCIDQWLENHRSCPLCRGELLRELVNPVA